MSDNPRADQTHDLHPQFEYWVGGSLPLEALSYVKRQADEDFYAGLKAGEFCYVLNARQMGKSSLRVRTMKRLQDAGVVCVSIDITAGGSTEVTVDQFYFGLLWEIVEQVQVQTNSLNDWDFNRLLEWWDARVRLPFVQRWRAFIEEVLLESVQPQIVIFVDEIDSVLGLPFRADDFFAAIREAYNRRVDQPSYERLTFALLGVCAPQDLIQDKRRTPFNIGRSIELSGFTEEEAIGLVRGLPGGEETLKGILSWTGGQPFLTQRACRLILDSSEPIISNIEFRVETLIQSQIIQSWESNDEQVHFRTIQDRVVSDESIATALIALYQQILIEDSARLEVNREQLALRLTGLVVKCSDRLVVSNRIYSQVFNLDWVSRKLSELRPYGEVLRKWSESGDENFLLRGHDLRLAQIWAEEKERKLAPEDYRFLQASQNVERSFKFNNGYALNIYELVELCEKYPREATDYIKTPYIESWLAYNLGQPNFAAIANGVKGKYGQDYEKALEVFVRLICHRLGYDASPLVVLSPQNLDIGQVPIGCSREIKIEVSVVNRGFVWGEITYKSETTGVNIKKLSFDSRRSKNLTININLPCDINIVKSGKYFVTGYLKFEGVDEVDGEHSFRVAYEVIPATVRVTPESIQLGVVKSIGRVTKGKILVQTKEDKNLRIIGSVTSSNPRILKIFPETFNSSTSIEYVVNPRNSVVGVMETEVNIVVNGERTSIPFKFVAGIDYAYLFLSRFPISMAFASVSLIIRLGLESRTLRQDMYSIIAIIALIGLSIVLSILTGSSEKITGRLPSDSKSKKNARNSTPAINRFLLILISIMILWIIKVVGLLELFGYLIFLIFETTSNLFYLIGIEPVSVRWAMLSYCLATLYFLTSSWRKMVVRT